MDPSLYKTVTTKRGLKYNCAFVPAEGTAKDTILFIHGWPSTSYEWRHQVDFFKKAGFALIIPDMLGSGQSDKPKDVGLFSFKAMAGDIIDILDAENVGKVIVVGHDWGSTFVSRLASYHPERFKAFAFVAVGYAPTAAGFDYEGLATVVKQAIGYETSGYWPFWMEDGADKVIEEHLESFFSILYPSDPGLWKTDFAPRGAVKEWLLKDKRAPLPSYLTEEDLKRMMEPIKAHGINSSLNWYKFFWSGIGEEDKGIPPANIVINQPVLYCACQHDVVCPSMLHIHPMQPTCPKLTIKEFATGHWVMLEAPDQFNAGLLEWVNSIEERA